MLYIQSFFSRKLYIFQVYAYQINVSTERVLLNSLDLFKQKALFMKMNEFA